MPSGPAPKDPRRRARRNADPIPTSIIAFEPAAQPPLPAGVDWHERTVAWWAVWRDCAQAELFTSTDWDFMLDTALMHHALWSKQQWTLAAEVRLRVAKFGATPEDRARLRMQFADADEKDAKRTPPAVPTRQRRGTLHALKPAADAVATD